VMNDEEVENSEMERELEALQPVALDELAEARLAMGLEGEAQKGVAAKVLWFRIMPMAGVAAVLVVGLFFLLRVEGDSEAEVSTSVDGGGGLWARLEPVAAQNYLRGTSEGGIAFVSGETPYRAVYRDYEDAYRWRDPETETELTYYQPRREVVYVPVEVY
jgi:hypothetical protein